MIRKFTTAMFALMLFSGTVSAAEKLRLDAEKSKIQFIGSKPDGKHDGGFKKFTAEAAVDMEDHSNSSLAIVIDTASLWSDNDKLTNHLKNPDFFDVRKHAKIMFKSTKIEHEEGSDKASITGTLTMLGKDVEVTLPVKATATDSGITLAGEFKIDRTKWGMTYGQGKINNDVVIKTMLVLER